MGEKDVPIRDRLHDALMWRNQGGLRRFLEFIDPFSCWDFSSQSASAREEPFKLQHSLVSSSGIFMREKSKSNSPWKCSTFKQLTQRSTIDGCRSTREVYARRPCYALIFLPKQRAGQITSCESIHFSFLHHFKHPRQAGAIVNFSFQWQTRVWTSFGKRASMKVVRRQHLDGF